MKLTFDGSDSIALSFGPRFPVRLLNQIPYEEEVLHTHWFSFFGTGTGGRVGHFSRQNP
jgi:hypothetical protein